MEVKVSDNNGFWSNGVKPVTEGDGGVDRRMGHVDVKDVNTAISSEHRDARDIDTLWERGYGNRNGRQWIFNKENCASPSVIRRTNKAEGVIVLKRATLKGFVPVFLDSQNVRAQLPDFINGSFKTWTV